MQFGPKGGALGSFSSVLGGTATILTGDTSILVANAAITASSVVIVCPQNLVQNAGSVNEPWWVQWGSGSFTITTSAAMVADTPFSYLVLVA